MGCTREEREKLRALLAKATPGAWAASVNTVDRGTDLDLTHGEMLDLISQRICRGGTRLHIVHVPAEENETGPLVVCDAGNGPRSATHAALIAAAINALPALLDALDAVEPR